MIMFKNIRPNTMATITPPLIPSFPSEGKKSGVFEPKVAAQMEGGFAKPEHRALKTANDSSCPLYVRLLTTMAG